MQKLFIVSTFDCSFQYYSATVKQWIREYGEGIVKDYELVKLNDNKSYSFYTVSSLKEFVKMLNNPWSKEWDKTNNCKDKIYKIELVEWMIIKKDGKEYKSNNIWTFFIYGGTLLFGLFLVYLYSAYIFINKWMHIIKKIESKKDRNINF